MFLCAAVKVWYFSINSQENLRTIPLTNPGFVPPWYVSVEVHGIIAVGSQSAGMTRCPFITGVTLRSDSGKSWTDGLSYLFRYALEISRMHLSKQGNPDFLYLPRCISVSKEIWAGSPRVSEAQSCLGIPGGHHSRSLKLLSPCLGWLKNMGNFGLPRLSSHGTNRHLLQ